MKDTQLPSNNFRCDKTFYRHTFVNRRYLTPLMEELLDSPDSVMAEHNILKTDRTNTIVHIPMGEFDVVIKRNNLHNILHAIKRCCRMTRGMRAWRYAHLLNQIGVDTPRPMAMIENHWGPLRKNSYYLYEFIPGTLATDYFLNPQIDIEEKENMAKIIVSTLNKMHSAGVTHGDTKATNFIIHDGKAWVLDLDATGHHCCKHRLKRAKAKDIARFMRCWEEDKNLQALFQKCFDEYYIKNFTSS